jgi:RIO kinase 1
MEVRQNVLVMAFIGHDGDAAPRLKDCEVDLTEWRQLYLQCALQMRKMLQMCKLVHGDLSEYNMLYDGDLVIIDVSQSMEWEHPQALEFLKRDCVNVNNFFAKQIGRSVIPVRQLFDFVLNRDLYDASGRQFSEDETTKALELLFESAAAKRTEDEEHEEEVFVQTWIPSGLDQMADPNEIEKEIRKRGRGEQLLYERLLAQAGDRDLEQSDEDEGEEGEDRDDPTPGKSATLGNPDDVGDPDDIGNDSNDSNDDVEDADKGMPKNNGHKPEGLSKAEWKAQVKAERKVKREDKIPKALKKKYRKNAAKR